MTTLVSERSPITTPKLRDPIPAQRTTARTSAAHTPAAAISSRPQAAPRASLIFRVIATLLEWHHRRVVRRELGSLCCLNVVAGVDTFDQVCFESSGDHLLVLRRS